MAVTKLSNSGIKTGVLKYDSMLAGNPAYIPTNWNSITTTTLSVAASSISITGIPQTYKHLQIRCLARKSVVGGGYSYVRLNSTNGYFNNYIYGNPYTLSQTKANGNTYAEVYGLAANSSTSANAWGYSIIEIFDYTANKVPIMKIHAGNPMTSNSYAQSISISQSQAYAIGSNPVTAFEIIADEGNFIAGTTVAIYGIG